MGESPEGLQEVESDIAKAIILKEMSILAKSKTLKDVLNDLRRVDKMTMALNGEPVEEYRLAKDIQDILRCIMMELKGLHDKKKIHGSLSTETIVAWKEKLGVIDGVTEYKWEVKLLCSYDCGDGQYKKDMEGLINLIDEILQHQPIPKDVAHLKDMLEKGMSTAFLCLHPCLWTSMQEMINVEQMRMAHKKAESHKYEIEVGAQGVPMKITQNWDKKIPPGSFLVKVKRKGNYDHLRTPALKMLYFMRDVYNHAKTTEGEEHFDCKKLQETLYCIYPEFMSNFVEQIFGIKQMRDALQDG
ncbi:uncharacterized protein LOC112536524 [Ricinus communis]|uniref:uncharacterized protein LOC112536524 n=1 Tax=Ricinus communis TaxID=3988 RepID=UPI000D6931EF|nr:uncharacterized protein LOC112536524 [Ricinus communis]XP_048235029.1 uncharacterized protein LOC112536524 [Ricinus communis]|eukprot:XP_025015068.1 uncharacterized protein LOC112536524 [Ricinus communis]